ncbi:hypothetical protein [Lysobacter capsici]|uniref:hypothetical protein n=1 Tax=Lysobacter capsici TaxID=435897 RepID=UPI001BFFE866|nr:hypothetical protein [Lysobacter capsici]QWF18218.1 hypothetical protein KME82_05480 [Lysobacter capsici]
MTVNNPAYFFFRPLARNAAPTPPRARSKNARAHRRVRHAFRSMSLKPKRGAAFSALAIFRRWFLHARASRATRVANDSDRLYRKKKFRSATAADFASHKPDCAKVRELFSAASGARDRRGGRRCGRTRRSPKRRRRANTATATRRHASARGADDTTVRRSRMPTHASCAHRVRTRPSARWKRFTGRRKLRRGRTKATRARRCASPRTAPHARVVMPRRHSDRLRIGASATRKWRGDKSRGGDAARRLAASRRLFTRPARLQAAIACGRIDVFAIAPIASSRHASGVRGTHEAIARKPAAILRRRPQARTIAMKIAGVFRDSRECARAVEGMNDALRGCRAESARGARPDRVRFETIETQCRRRIASAASSAARRARRRTVAPLDRSSRPGRRRAAMPLRIRTSRSSRAPTGAGATGTAPASSARRIAANETGSESRAPRSRAGPALPVGRGRCRPRRVDQWSSSSSSSA